MWFLALGYKPQRLSLSSAVMMGKSFTMCCMIAFLMLLCTYERCIQRGAFFGAHTSTTEATGVHQPAKGITLWTPYLGHDYSQQNEGWVTQKYGRRSALRPSLGLWPWTFAFVPMNQYNKWKPAEMEDKHLKRKRKVGQGVTSKDLDNEKDGEWKSKDPRINTRDKEEKAPEEAAKGSPATSA